MSAHVISSSLVAKEQTAVSTLCAHQTAGIVYEYRSRSTPTSGRPAPRRDLQEECLAQRAHLAYRRHHVAGLHHDHSVTETAWQQQRAALQEQLAGLQLEVATAQAQLAGSNQGTTLVSLQVRRHQGLSSASHCSPGCLTLPFCVACLSITGLCCCCMTCCLPHCYPCFRLLQQCHATMLPPRWPGVACCS